MAQEFIFERDDPFSFLRNFDEKRNDIYGYGGGSEALYVADFGPQISGGVNVPVSFESTETSPTIIGQLAQGIPVTVSVRGTLDGAPKAYDNGHLLVIVGWNAKKKAVICHDPAFDNHQYVLKQYPVQSFIRAWENSRRLAYWVDPVRM